MRFGSYALRKGKKGTQLPAMQKEKSDNKPF
jgi:hypothetical protein